MIETSTAPSGTQALMRGLAVVEAVAEGCTSLATIGERIDCSRSTTHRLVAALVSAGYLRQGPDGYRLGSHLIGLGARAREQSPLSALARPILLQLAEQCGDTVHLGIREDDDVLYLEKVAGSRGLEMRSRIGLRMPLALTGVGRALMLMLPESEWQRLFERALAERPASGVITPAHVPPEWPDYRARLHDDARRGVVFDLEDNELGIRCVAAPVRDDSGDIVAAISVASASPWMPESRLDALAPEVSHAAHQLSRELGWRDS
ncbi:IclR family transcriptional regulator [Kushneria phosphatilytica]|uniref:IclR family transcriptional regulator n=1 Tax=Kushneria phosphatilytica TaxID=657387 RepID=A0A1S1NRT8_9GAMM|nr:IclR family transcriptional regulator [Kushneria phosphatilytica]OHV08724.1 transcriptional regulator [Kushneria phosphatilytica]QEL12448.1 IclR family transcriptional regulator [Kushneria phosphatilytica]